MIVKVRRYDDAPLAIIHLSSRALRPCLLLYEDELFKKTFLHYMPFTILNADVNVAPDANPDVNVVNDAYVFSYSASTSAFVDYRAPAATM